MLLVCRAAARIIEVEAISPLWDARPAGVLFLRLVQAGRADCRLHHFLDRIGCQAESGNMPAGIIAAFACASLAANRTPIDAIPT